MRDVNEGEVAGALDVIYDAAVSPTKWPEVLKTLGRLFDSHFVDIFARTEDRSQHAGHAIGLSDADYQDEFLGVWCNRNVWSQTKPVRVAGEVLATWQMVGRQDLVRSAIFNEYLQPRDLHEGLRLALWAGDGWVQDISLLRPFSRGPFDAGELALGRVLLPHLQRAAGVSRRLQGMLAPTGQYQSEQPTFLLDHAARLLRSNAAGDRLLAPAFLLQLVGGILGAVADVDGPRLTAAIASAASFNQQLPAASNLTMSDYSGVLYQVTVLPVKQDAEWAMPGPRAVLVVVTEFGSRVESRIESLIARHGLTRAEAVLAAGLLSGRSVQEIATRSGRSVHTTRSHLARVMEKTRTRRQSQLIQLLMQGEAAETGASPMPWLAKPI